MFSNRRRDSSLNFARARRDGPARSRPILTVLCLGLVLAIGFNAGNLLKRKQIEGRESEGQSDAARFSMGSAGANYLDKQSPILPASEWKVPEHLALEPHFDSMIATHIYRRSDMAPFSLKKVDLALNFERAGTFFQLGIGRNRDGVYLVRFSREEISASYLVQGEHPVELKRVKRTGSSALISIQINGPELKVREGDDPVLSLSQPAIGEGAISVSTDLTVPEIGHFSFEALESSEFLKHEIV